MIGAETTTMGRPIPVLLERPWSRVKTPVAIPDPLGPAALLKLALEDFAVLVRDHLVPRDPGGPERDRWEQLWVLLGRDDQLAERVYDVLEDFLDQAEQALAGGGLDEHQRRRAQKFARFCEDSWQRLRVEDDKPLGWAGRAGSGFNPAARKVIEQLVDAIAEHRAAVTSAGTVRPTDRELWKALRDVGLDPEAGRRRRS